ncbi:MAG: histidine kinase dimerization/phospho-acceptor domain-containing protein [Dehalococcoidia bacterium]
MRGGSFFPVRVGDELIGIGAVVEEVTAQRKRGPSVSGCCARSVRRRGGGGASHPRRACLGTVSHDLRGPLTAMKGYTQLLRRQIAGDDAPRTDAIEALDQVAAAVGRMERMIDELMDTARLQSGLPLDLEPVAA